MNAPRPANGIRALIAGATPLRLYNTRTRSAGELSPLDGEHVRIYVCGLTPSAEAHLGHARSFLLFDVLRRYLVHRGVRVTFVQNVTDIDDRSIATARTQGVTWRDVVERHLSDFKASMRRLHVLEPDVEPRATEYVPQIIEMIAELLERGFAYVASDGVYYRVKAFRRYGELSHRNVEELKVGARIEPDEGKDDPLDFALWKFAKPGEPRWPSPWGDGRPGWHIECSAMSRALLGVPFDVHGGGLDLVFPHHENEVAQSEALMPRPPMANIWVHGGLLEFDGRKMSKSLGNFEPLSAVLDRHDPQAVRLLFLGTGYRKPMNFREEAVRGATVALRRLYEAYDALREQAPGPDPARPPSRRIAEARERFEGALDDDLNTAGATAVLFDIAGAWTELAASGLSGEAAGFMHEAMAVLGISPNERTLPRQAPPLGDDVVPRLNARFPDIVRLGATPAEAADAVVEARNAARNARDFGRADALREALTEVGVALADTKEGTTWSVAG